MYKISVPISIESMHEDSLENDLRHYFDLFREGNIERVFIAVLSPVYEKKFDSDITSDKLKSVVRFFKERGMEVGIWIGGLGHGSGLSHEVSSEKKQYYSRLTGVMGESFEHGFCPLDENFKNDYMEAVKHAAALMPDLIMLDDDFRLNLRHYYFGCFCSQHMKEFYRLIDEEIPREKIESLIFKGGKNKYRDAYMEMSRKTLLDFAKSIRSAVSEIHSDIRVGICAAPDVWDMEGTDVIEISKALAGKNRPFIRAFGAPYHNPYVLTEAIENERLQMNWIKKSDNNIETFAEGDVYPRPRYNVPAKALQLFELALKCAGCSDGILKYMFTYDFKPGYENGYIENHIKGLEQQNRAETLFGNKQITGVSVYSAMHKFENFDFSESYESGMADRTVTAYQGFTADMLSKNSIPTCYEKSEYPVMVCGESAKYIPLERLENGAVLDAPAAAILSERGVDTGLLSLEKSQNCTGEYFYASEDTVNGFGNCRFYNISCDNRAEILSVLLPENMPGAYKYENNEGIRFLVFAGDFQFTPGSIMATGNANYFNNYYRKNQIITGIEWVGRKKLPVVSGNNPNLYMLSAYDENSAAFLLINLNMDDVFSPEVVLSRSYTGISTVNCSGALKGNTVRLSDIPAYGFAAFEVTE